MGQPGVGGRLCCADSENQAECDLLEIFTLSLPPAVQQEKLFNLCLAAATHLYFLPPPPPSPPFISLSHLLESPVHSG